MKNTFLIALLLGITGAALAQPATKAVYLLKAGKFYDADQNVFLLNQQVLVEGSRITKIGAKINAPKGAVIIDLPNATVTPGLIDAHTHLLTVQQVGENLAVDALMKSGESRVLRAVGLSRSYLDAGFTSVRDLGNSGYYLDVELKRAINSGYITAPRMFVSGPILSAPDGQFFRLPIKEQDKITRQEYRVINNVEDAKIAVKEHVNNSVDVIKIVAWGERMGLSVDEMKAIVEAAHNNRLKVTAHANADWVIRDAIAAGVDGIEHAYSVSDSTLALMKSRNVYLVATDPSVDLYVKSYETMNIKEFSRESILKELQPLHDRLMRAFKQGVTLVAGSDMYVDLKMPVGDAAKHTLLAYFEAGLKPADVLRTSTWNAAVALGKKDQLGVLKENASADITIFDGDLEKDFRTVLFKVKMIFKDGDLVYGRQ